MPNHDDPIPSRAFAYCLKRLKASPGAHKEKVRERQYRRERRYRRERPQAPRRDAELHVASMFSFLDDTSQPEDLIEACRDARASGGATGRSLGGLQLAALPHGGAGSGHPGTGGRHSGIHRPDEKRARRRPPVVRPAGRPPTATSLVLLGKGAGAIANSARSSRPGVRIETRLRRPAISGAGFFSKARCPRPSASRGSSRVPSRIRKGGGAPHLRVCRPSPRTQGERSSPCSTRESRPTADAPDHEPRPEHERSRTMRGPTSAVPSKLLESNAQ